MEQQVYDNSKAMPASEITPKKVYYARCSSLIIRKDGRPEIEAPGDEVRQISNGMILLDGAGGEGVVMEQNTGPDGQITYKKIYHDWKAAQQVGHAIATKFNEICPNLPEGPIQTGNVPFVRESVVESFISGALSLKTAEDNGEINRGADTTANLAVIVNTAGERTLVFANVGDGTTYIRNRETGELRIISTEHSLVSRLVAANKMTQEEALVSPQRNVVLKLVSQSISKVVSKYGGEPLTPENKQKVRLEVAEIVELKETRLKPEEDVVCFSDGITDNATPDHLADLSRRHAIAKNDSSNFVHAAVEFAHNLANNSVVIIQGRRFAKGRDDCSGFSLT